MRVTALIALGLIASPVEAQKHDPVVLPQFVGVWDNAPDMTCYRPISISQDDYGFALAVLSSLSFGKQASDRSVEIKPAIASVQDMTSLMTELLRISKEQAADFACSEAPLAAFNQPSTDPMTRMIAQNKLFSWHQQIELNGRVNTLTKSLGTLQPGDMAEKMSTMQVDRGNLWKSLSPLVSVVLLKLVDDKRVSSTNTLPYLTISKVQKTDLIAKVREYFPEVDKQQQKDMDSATFEASLYLYLLTNRKGSDEL